MFDETVKADMTLLSYMKEMGKNRIYDCNVEVMFPKWNLHLEILGLVSGSEFSSVY